MAQWLGREQTEPRNSSWGGLLKKGPGGRVSCGLLTARVHGEGSAVVCVEAAPVPRTLVCSGPRPGSGVWPNGKRGEQGPT